VTICEALCWPFLVGYHCMIHIPIVYVCNFTGQNTNSQKTSVHFPSEFSFHFSNGNVSNIEIQTLKTTSPFSKTDIIVGGKTA